MVADIEELDTRRLNAKEVLTPMKSVIFMFPFADGTVKVSGGDQNLRTSTSFRARPDRGEEQGSLQGESDLLQPHFETHRGMMLKLEMISGQIQAILFTVTTYTETSLDVMLEKHIEDYWNVDVDRELSDTWTGFTRFILWNEKPPD